MHIEREVPEPEQEHFRFVLPANLEYRDAARAFLAYILERLVRRQAFAEDVSHRVISAFVEAFNNAVIHGHSGRPGGCVEVVMEVQPELLRLQVIDQGRPFAPDQVPDPDLDALPEGGMGLFIMRSFMDRVKHARVQDKNVLTLEKVLRVPDRG